MPQSRWVVSEVTVNDGFTDSADEKHTYSSEYSYEEGKYDRGEREFYGFAKVTKRRPDSSTVEHEYHTENFYLKGMEKGTIGKDGLYTGICNIKSL